MNVIESPYRVAPKRTAFGVPLEQSERVIGVYDTTLRLAQGFLIAVGSSLLGTIGIVGICDGEVRGGLMCIGCIVPVVAFAGLMEMFEARRILVTDLRVLLVARKCKPRTMRLADVTDVKAARLERLKYAQGILNEVEGGTGGVPLADLARDVRKADSAEQKPRTSRAYWKGASGIMLIGRSSKLRLPILDASELGLLLARCAFKPGFLEKAPEVAFDP